MSHDSTYPEHFAPARAVPCARRTRIPNAAFAFVWKPREGKPSSGALGSVRRNWKKSMRWTLIIQDRPFSFRRLSNLQQSDFPERNFPDGRIILRLDESLNSHKISRLAVPTLVHNSIWSFAETRQLLVSIHPCASTRPEMCKQIRWIRFFPFLSLHGIFPGATRASRAIRANPVNLHRHREKSISTTLEVTCTAWSTTTNWPAKRQPHTNYMARACKLVLDDSAVETDEGKGFVLAESGARRKLDVAGFAFNRHLNFAWWKLFPFFSLAFFFVFLFRGLLYLPEGANLPSTSPKGVNRVAGTICQCKCSHFVLNRFHFNWHVYRDRLEMWAALMNDCGTWIGIRFELRDEHDCTGKIDSNFYSSLRRRLPESSFIDSFVESARKSKLIVACFPELLLPRSFLFGKNKP